MVVSGAEIQPDKNWTKIHNSILELLATSNFTSRELRCLLFLLRMTYGFQKKDARISLSEWEKGTGLKRGHVNSTLKKLTELNVIIKDQETPRSTPVWMFNKYHEEWVASTPVGTTLGSTPIGTTDGTPIGTKGSTPFHPETTPIKESEKETKENSNGGCSEKPNDGLKEVTRFYESNIGTLTEYTKQELESLVADYGGADVVVDAMRVAVQANKKSLRYTHGVLRNWHADGKDGNKAPAMLPQATLPSTLPASVFDV